MRRNQTIQGAGMAPHNRTVSPGVHATPSGIGHRGNRDRIVLDKHIVARTELRWRWRIVGITDDLQERRAAWAGHRIVVNDPIIVGDTLCMPKKDGGRIRRYIKCIVIDTDARQRAVAADPDEERGAQILERKPGDAIEMRIGARQGIKEDGLRSSRNDTAADRRALQRHPFGIGQRDRGAPGTGPIGNNHRIAVACGIYRILNIRS